MSAAVSFMKMTNKALSRLIYNKFSCLCLQMRPIGSNPSSINAYKNLVIILWRFRGHEIDYCMNVH